MRVRISQQGRMRFKPRGRWLSFTATQEYDVRKVAFTWRARFRLAPLVWLSVIDTYEGGVGQLEARLWGAVRIMRSSGTEVSKAEALRYLAELFWTPFSIEANAGLRWREVQGVAEAATAVGTDQVAVRFEFDADGDLVGVSTDARPRQVGPTTVSTAWRGEARDYEAFGGLRLPRRAAVWWELPDGPFRYWEGEVTAVAVAPPVPPIHRSTA